MIGLIVVYFTQGAWIQAQWGHNVNYGSWDDIYCCHTVSSPIKCHMTTSQIKPLPENLVNQIAAGESFSAPPPY